MQYFVSIENKAYHHWQIELLIQSFKEISLEDKLIIGVANKTDGVPIDFTHNLKSWDLSRIFLYDNLGKEKNRAYGLFHALKENKIKQPVTLIDPDMIILNPVAEEETNVVFQVDNFAGFSKIEKQVLEIKKFRNIEEPVEKLWIPLGKVMNFNNVPLHFFERVLKWSETILSGDERFPWILAMIEYNGLLNYKGVYSYETGLFPTSKDANFIHYNKGLAPNFHKSKYTYDGAFMMGNPFDDILSSPTPEYLQKITKAYLESLPTVKRKLDFRELSIGKVKVEESKNGLV